MTDKAAFRIRRRYTPTDKPKKYRGSYELYDEQRQCVVVQCDLIGQALFSTLIFIDEDKATWTMKPNRKILPTRWLLTGKDIGPAWQFDQRIVGKLLNPLHKTVIAVFDSSGNELMRLVNLHNKKAAVILGLESGTYALVKEDRTLAKITTLPRENRPTRKGLAGTLRRFFTASDTAIVSLTDRNPLAPPATLALYLLFDELTDTSA